MGNNQKEWVDLRDDGGRLYGRLNRSTLDLKFVRGDREVVFDLVATARDGYAVTERRVIERAPLTIANSGRTI